MVQEPTWLACAFQPWTLLLHLHLLNAPLLAKFYGVLRRIREADTQRLQLWDGAARRRTAAQLALVVTIQLLHLGVVSEHFDGDLQSDPGAGCVDGSVLTAGGGRSMTDRLFYLSQSVLLLVLIVPSPVIYVLVTGSSFAPLFPEWNSLCQAVQALLFAAVLSGTTFFVDEVQQRERERESHRRPRRAARTPLLCAAVSHGCSAQSLRCPFSRAPNDRRVEC